MQLIQNEEAASIDKDILEQEGIVYDEENDLYYDMETGELIDMQFIEARLQELEQEAQRDTLQVETAPSVAPSAAPSSMVSRPRSAVS